MADNLERLVEGARAAHPSAEVHVRCVSGSKLVVVSVSVGGAVLVETLPGPLQDAIYVALSRLLGLSSRVRVAIDPADAARYEALLEAKASKKTE